MNILVVSHVERDPDGGACQCTLALAQAWRNEGYDVRELYAADLPSPPLKKLANEWWAITLPFAIRRQLSWADVIVVTGPIAGPLFLFLLIFGSRLPKRLVRVYLTYGLEHDDHEVRLTEARRGGPPISWGYRARTAVITLPLVQLGIVCSQLFVAARQSTVAFTINRGWTTPESSLAVRWGSFDVAGSSVALETRLLAKRLVWCGSLVERKGWAYVVEAFEALHAHDSEYTLHVLGSGTPGPLVLQQFRRCVRPSVTVYPRLKRTEQLGIVSESSVFIGASLSEGYHLALQEAMAVGTPCVATREGFLADVGSPESLAFIVAKRNPEALMQGILSAVDDVSATSGRSQAAKEWVAANSWYRAALEIETAVARLAPTPDKP